SGISTTTMFPAITGSRKLLRIGVTFALPSEFAGWRRQAGFSRLDSADIPLYRARIGDAEVSILITGVGCRSVAGELRSFVELSDVCVASGVIGGLRKGLLVGTVLVAKAVTEDSAAEFITSDEHLVQTAQRCGATVVSHFLTTASVVSTSEEKQRLGVV